MPDAKCGFDGDARGPARGLLVAYGPTLIVDIGFDPLFDPHVEGRPASAVRGLHALVDTGATISCIDSALAATLDLPIIDRQPMAGVGGVHEANMHLAQIYVLELNFTIYGSFAAVNLAASGQPHVALIGRTFLQNVTMTYDGRAGTVTITL